MSARALPFITPEQYLEIERAAEFKSEYHDGQMFAMSGGSLSHSVIPARLITALSNALGGRPCEVATSDLKVRVGPKGPFFYPDVTVYCGEPELADDHSDVLLNPKVVFEVLSKSSEAYDRGYKFAQYRSIPSLREYVLVSQAEPRIEVFSKTSEVQWMFNEFVGADSICRLRSLDCDIALAGLYRGR